MALALLSTAPAWAQFTDGSTGLLQMPTAEMQADGTFMVTTNFLNKHSLSTSGWGYDTFQYGISISFWGRLEIGYVCTIFNDYWKGSQTREGVWMINQDRHFVGRVMLLREGELGNNWVPSLVVGVSDPTTGSGGGEYISGTGRVEGSTNGYFNRYYVVFTKHFDTSWGLIGTHAGYQFNRRSDYPINRPCVGVDWTPVWIQNKGIFDNVKFILEYDSRTVNMGLLASIWDNHFEAMLELQDFQWVNFGLRYRLKLKKTD